jgi:hypothetical protein
MSDVTDRKARGLAWIAAERVAGREPGNADVRRQFDVTERTARSWLNGTTGNSAAPPPRPATPAATRQPAHAAPGNTPAPGGGNGKPEAPGNRPAGKPAPAETGNTGTRRRWLRRRRSEPASRQPARRRGRWLPMAVTGIGITAVVAAPVAISARSLAGWGREALGLTGGWEWLAPVPLDGAALACVGLALHATQRGEAPGLSRILVWVLAAGSAWANWRHGATISPDAALYFAVQPLLAALLLDLVLRRVRHDALGDLGALERPLARYRMARWLVAPRETWRAWRTAVCDGITDPDEALARVRRLSVSASKDRGDAGATAVTRLSSEAS